MVTRRENIETLRIRSILFHDHFTRYLTMFTILSYALLIVLSVYCNNNGLIQITAFIPSLAELV